MKPFVPLLATFGLSVALAVAPLAPDAPQALTLPMISADKTFTVDVDGDGRKDRIALYYEDTTMLVKVTTARKKKSSFRTDAGEFNQPAGRAASSKNGDEVDCLGNQGARDGDDGFLDELFEASQRANAGTGMDGADPARVARPADRRCRDRVKFVGHAHARLSGIQARREDEAGDPGEHAVSPEAVGSSSGFVLENGQEDTYDDADTVPLPDALAAVCSILDTGRPPRGMPWTVDR